MIIITNPVSCLKGELTVPGDKSITHRALILGALARGITLIRGGLDADDCRSTIACLQQLGVSIIRQGRIIQVKGTCGHLAEPSGTLDAGNSGTTARLLLGVLASQQFATRITGDQSLVRRPMKRVVEPLRMMGAVIEGEGEFLPLTIKGGSLRGTDYRSAKASAQVKSAVLLASLGSSGRTSFYEPSRSRNHTELMLQAFGAKLAVSGTTVAINGPQRLNARKIYIPGDISAAAFFMVAAALVPGSDLLLKAVGVNETRSGIIDVLLRMGVDLQVTGKRFWGRELVANIRVRGGRPLKSTTIAGDEIPRLIDEIPVIAVAAATAEGETVIRDADELRVKESDRISVLTGQLTRLGADVTETPDGLAIRGGVRLIGAETDSGGDHRIAMALAVAGLIAEGETAVHNAGSIDISYPRFMDDLRSLVGGKR